MPHFESFLHLLLSIVVASLPEGCAVDAMLGLCGIAHDMEEFFNGLPADIPGCKGILMMHVLACFLWGPEEEDGDQESGTTLWQLQLRVMFLVSVMKNQTANLEEVF